MFDEGGVEQHNFIRAAPNELFTGQQTAAHQTIVDKFVTCYIDPLALSTVQDSDNVLREKHHSFKTLKKPL